MSKSDRRMELSLPCMYCNAVVTVTKAKREELDKRRTLPICAECRRSIKYLSQVDLFGSR